MAYAMGNLGDNQRQSTRSMGRVLQDLMAWAEVHNGDCLTVVAWHALGLLRDIEARKSKVLLLGLTRTQSSDPKTYYLLKDVCVVPMADVKRAFKSTSQRPSHALRENEEQRKKDGAIGAMLVISVEQEDDDTRPVAETLGKVAPIAMQPLGVFEVHRKAFQRTGPIPESLWKACLINSLRGGLFAPTFRTS
ncbi:hypothetical protein C8R47DRAFT_1208348 [Mycena vitilis]|nr:hypothetical protein C8R47DRAFT_1231376 [Mycena vitilis]KAJ6509144.1 hypothetical protein C8R47DRAFT_1208348 [Mycena vitilis]